MEKNNIKTPNILITGGHITPALGLVDELKGKKYKIVFIGRKYATDTDTIPSLEYQNVQKRGLKFYNLKTEKLRRDEPLRSVFLPFMILYSVIRSIQILKKEKPQAVVSFGGYIALPVCIAAKALCIPILTHEQTMVFGLSNRIIAHIADTVCISWKKTEGKIDHPHIVLTGNPIQKIFFLPSPKPQFWQDIPIGKPIAYITGGNLGSHAINDIVLQNLTRFLSEFILIHQSGNTSKYNDFQRLQKAKIALHSNLQNRYILIPHLSPKEVSYTMKHADILVGRSGANTVTEILATHIPAVLIPLPRFGAGEQEKHAQFIEDYKLGLKLLQKDLSAQNLLKNMQYVYQKRSEIKEKSKNLNKTMDIKKGAAQIAEEVEKLLKKKI